MEPEGDERSADAGAIEIAIDLTEPLRCTVLGDSTAEGSLPRSLLGYVE